MVVIIMPSHSTLTSLVKQLRTDFPQITFTKGASFQWSPDTRTITYAPALQAGSLLLHELGHALLGHADFSVDIALLRLEAAAWEHAVSTLAPRYDVAIDEDYLQSSLDTYRDWLHRRSSCPGCSQTGIQHQKNTYSCLNCRYSWRVNDARQCGLRRFKLQAQGHSG